MSREQDAKQRVLQNALRDRMSDISEDYYCAGWMGGLEYDLWRIVQGGSRGYGMGSLTDSEVEELRALSEMAGGWHDGDRFIPLDEWLEIFAAIEKEQQKDFRAYYGKPQPEVVDIITGRRMSGDSETKEQHHGA